MAAAVHPPRIVHQDTPTSSPKDTKKSLMKQEDTSRHASPQQKQDSRQNSPPQPVQPPEAAPTAGANGDKKETNAQPLGPPPKPAASGEQLDYFNGAHGTTFNSESNPFESAFGVQPPADTPGKITGLPSVASLTSPAGLLQSGTPGWSDSLRSGPLSPAMLTGPNGGSDYFGSNFRGSFPTPNESSLRTGLTPGGGGSMFPAPSPNSQLMGLLGSGGITPGFQDFHKTALSAASRQNQNNITSNGQQQNPDANNQFAQEEAKPGTIMPDTSQAADPFGHQASNEAAYGLHMLTQAATGRNGNFNGMQNQPSNIQTNVGMMGGQSQDTSPLSRRGNTKNSIGSMNSGSLEHASDTGESEQTKPTTRSRGGKKGAAANGKANNRRKADETPAKAPASKKARANSGGAMPPDDMDDMDDDDDDMGNMDTDMSGKKMTDEEKRKNFLERNRVAALKCRQRKKQWLQNLQNKVEIYSAENDALSGQVQSLREEIVNLKTLLIAHKECPVAAQQGLGGMAMHNYLESSGHPHSNPYGLGMPNGMQMQGMGMNGGPMQQPQRT